MSLSDGLLMLKAELEAEEKEEEVVVPVLFDDDGHSRGDNDTKSGSRRRGRSRSFDEEDPLDVSTRSNGSVTSNNGNSMRQTRRLQRYRSLSSDNPTMAAFVAAAAAVNQSSHNHHTLVPGHDPDLLSVSNRSTGSTSNRPPRRLQRYKSASSTEHSSPGRMVGRNHSLRQRRRRSTSPGRSAQLDLLEEQGQLPLGSETEHAVQIPSQEPPRRRRLKKNRSLSPTRTDSNGSGDPQNFQRRNCNGGKLPPRRSVSTSGASHHHHHPGPRSPRKSRSRSPDLTSQINGNLPPRRSGKVPMSPSRRPSVFLDDQNTLADPDDHHHHHHAVHKMASGSSATKTTLLSSGGEETAFMSTESIAEDSSFRGGLEGLAAENVDLAQQQIVGTASSSSSNLIAETLPSSFSKRDRVAATAATATTSSTGTGIANSRRGRVARSHSISGDTAASRTLSSASPSRRVPRRSKSVDRRSAALHMMTNAASGAPVPRGQPTRGISRTHSGGTSHGANTHVRRKGLTRSNSAESIDVEEFPNGSTQNLDRRAMLARTSSGGMSASQELMIQTIESMEAEDDAIAAAAAAVTSTTTTSTARGGRHHRRPSVGEHSSSRGTISRKSSDRSNGERGVPADSAGMLSQAEVSRQERRATIKAQYRSMPPKSKLPSSSPSLALMGGKVSQDSAVRHSNDGNVQSRRASLDIVTKHLAATSLFNPNSMAAGGLTPDGVDKSRSGQATRNHHRWSQVEGGPISAMLDTDQSKRKHRRSSNESTDSGFSGLDSSTKEEWLDDRASRQGKILSLTHEMKGRFEMERVNKDQEFLQQDDISRHQQKGFLFETRQVDNGNDYDEADQPMDVNTKKKSPFGHIVHALSKTAAVTKSAAKGSVNAVRDPKEVIRRMGNLSRGVAKGAAKGAANVVRDPKGAARKVGTVTKGVTKGTLGATKTVVKGGVNVTTHVAKGTVKGAGKVVTGTARAINGVMNGLDEDDDDDDDTMYYDPTTLASRNQSSLVDRVSNLVESSDDGSGGSRTRSGDVHDKHKQKIHEKKKKKKSVNQQTSTSGTATKTKRSSQNHYHHNNDNINSKGGSSGSGSATSTTTTAAAAAAATPTRSLLRKEGSVSMLVPTTLSIGSRNSNWDV